MMPPVRRRSVIALADRCLGQSLNQAGKATVPGGDRYLPAAIAVGKCHKICDAIGGCFAELTPRTIIRA